MEGIIQDTTPVGWATETAKLHPEVNGMDAGHKARLIHGGIRLASYTISKRKPKTTSPYCNRPKKGEETVGVAAAGVLQGAGV